MTILCSSVRATLFLLLGFPLLKGLNDLYLYQSPLRRLTTLRKVKSEEGSVVDVAPQDDMSSHVPTDVPFAVCAFIK